MRKHSRDTRGAWRGALVLLLSLIFAGCTGGARDSESGDGLPPVVATVEGREIPTKLYRMYLKNGREGLGLSEATEEGRRKLELLREGVVSELIDRALIAGEVERRRLAPAPERLGEAEQQAIARLGGEEKFSHYLKENDLTRDDYREVVRSELNGELLRAELNREVQVADEEVKAFYEAHRAEPEWQLPERVRAAHILILARPNVIADELESQQKLSGADLEQGVRRELARRRARVEELRRKAATGADFAALAREFSEDAGTREQGGDLGFFRRGTHTPAFDEAAFALKAGELSRVVETEYGFHLVKLLEREEPRALSLEEAAPAIRRRLLAPREAERLNSWLREARQRARVRLNEPFRFGKLKELYPAT